MLATRRPSGSVPRLASRRLGASLAALLLAASTVAAVRSADSVPDAVSFRNDVMPVLSKAGCNLGTCHGNKSGKGGFKLSLRGEDPTRDREALVRDIFGRRVDRIDPERSLILLKPTAAVSHEGGRRFAVGSREHRVLRDWIAAGMSDDASDAPRVVELRVEPRDVVLLDPDDRFDLRVDATFADGSVRDLREVAVYETSAPLATVTSDGRVVRADFGESTILVRYLHLQVAVRVAFVPARPGWDPQALASSTLRSRGYIDELVFARLERLRLSPSPRASDGVLLRRLHLDLLGAIPRADEVRAFLADDDPAKLERVVDDLLARPEFADTWALKWADLLRLEEKQLDRKGVQNFHHWIRTAIAGGRPLDAFARELLAARGSTYSNPAANFWRANRDEATRAEAVAQVFLGRRLQCARCHNHPFDRWTQDDYYDWAALFSRVRYKIVENRRRDSNDKHEFDGEQIVWTARAGVSMNPRTSASAVPRFLGETASRVAAGGDWLESVADWIASTDNPFFARAQANRVWFHLMGRGLVEPIDDFRATNPPSHPELLDRLADDFRASGFDLRHLIRTIVRSSTYALSTSPNDTNAGDDRNRSRATVRRLDAEPLIDSLALVTGAPPRFNGYPEGVAARQIPGINAVRDRDASPSEGDRFLGLFGKPPRLLTCECERSGETTLSQAIHLISGPLVHEMLARPGNRLDEWLESGASHREIAEDLWLTAIARHPSALELATAVGYLDGAEKRREALEDLTWSLVNSKEFILRR